MLYYATCNEIEQKIINSKDNKDRMRYGAQMEKLGLKALLKYINSFENEALSSENRRIIKSMFRAPLMLKLWNDEIEQDSVKNFMNEKRDVKYRMMNMNIHTKLLLIIPLQQKLFNPNLNHKILFIFFFNIVKMKYILLGQYLMD